MAREPVVPYEGTNKVVAVSRADKAILSDWKAKGCLPPYVASDHVFVRRVYLAWVDVFQRLMRQRPLLLIRHLLNMKI